jgi:hypothetical protein
MQVHPDVSIESCILGSIQVTVDAVRHDPLRLTITDSVLDATGSGRPALSTPDSHRAHTAATVLRTTVIGQVHAHEITLAENSIFDGHVDVFRRQTGCMRFCYVPAGSCTPRRFQCQPDLAEMALSASVPAGTDRDRERERLRVRPDMNSTSYGTPDYCQLSSACAEEITGGADDESEMGVFHDLYQPQRTAALRAAIDDNTPADVDAGILFAN